MSAEGALAFRPAMTPAQAFRLTGIVALPDAVTTAAWATPAGAELRVWIARPGTAQTLQLRVHADRRVEALAPLACVGAGAARCGRETVVTGADATGRPLVLGIADDGGTTWRRALDGPVPTRWPVPVCAPGPTIAWQTAAGRLDLARVDGGTLAQARSVAVGGPPLAVARGDADAGGGDEAGDGAGGDTVWAAWGEPDAVVCAEIAGTHVRAHRVAARFPGDVAVGSDAAGTCVAWTQRDGAHFARVGGDEPPVALDLGDAAGGTLALVSGPRALLWAQHADLLEGETPRWTSALVVPGREPLFVDGRVWAVTWWGDALAVVGPAQLSVLAAP